LEIVGADEFQPLEEIGNADVIDVGRNVCMRPTQAIVLNLTGG
jgi:hypothetical protein